MAFLYDPFARVLSIEAPWEEQDDKDNDVFHRPVLRYRVTETTQGELVLRSASALRLDTDVATKKQVGWFVANEYRLVPVPKRAALRK